MGSVIFDLAAQAIIVFTVFVLARKNERRFPQDNLVFLFSLILCVYTLLPVVNWMYNGGFYPSPSAGRLYWWQPSAAEQEYLTRLALLTQVGVLVGYLAAPRRVVIVEASECVIPSDVARIALVIFVMSGTIGVVLKLSGLIRESDSYIDSYLAIQELPLVVRQGLKILAGMALFCKIIVLVWLFQDWRRNRLIIGGVVILSLIAFDPNAGRAGLVITLNIIIILWNRYVRELNLFQFAVLVVVGLIAFTALGQYRGGKQENVSEGPSQEHTSLGEFEMLWGNAIEINRAASSGAVTVPWQLHLAEVLGPVPAVLLPFLKPNYSEWYLSEFYPQYQSEGGGLMFGILAQLALDYGHIGAPARGICIAAFMVGLSFYFKRQQAWWGYPAVVYLAVSMFQSVRDSSFALITPLLQVILPAVYIIGKLRWIAVPNSRRANGLRK